MPERHQRSVREDRFNVFRARGTYLAEQMSPRLLLLMFMSLLAARCSSSSAQAVPDAGAAGASGAGGQAGTGATVSCDFSQTASLSAKIGTVGIIDWTTSLSNVTSAHIDFGLTTSYGMVAPVDLGAPPYHTLLLGMKPSRTYHYRLVAQSAAGTCLGPDATLATGPIANGLGQIQVATTNAAALFGGFLLSGQFVTNGGTTGAPAFILDADGDYVWWYNTGSDVASARMSYDGTHIWLNSVNAGGAVNAANVHRVTMDGLIDEDLSAQFAGQNHQMAVLPDETVAFNASGSNNCDDIKERRSDGTVTTIINARTAHGGTGACHVNNVEYSKGDDTLLFSDLDNQDITKVTRSGQVVWVLNGVGNGFTGDAWKGGQHGIHILSPTDLLIFNNNSSGAIVGGQSGGGTGDGSIALEMTLDLTAMSAHQAWSYKASPGIQNDVEGDLQRLPNGNTVIAYSTKGALLEIDAQGNVLQTLTFKTSFGYIEKRATLYGPPPR